VILGACAPRGIVVRCVSRAVHSARPYSADPKCGSRKNARRGAGVSAKFFLQFAELEKASAASAASAASDRRAVAVALHAQPAPEVPGRSSKRATFGVAPKRLRPESFEAQCDTVRGASLR
jgi:hypothetical protein